LAAGRGKLSPHFGALADEPEEFFEGMKRVIASIDRTPARDPRKPARR